MKVVFCAIDAVQMAVPIIYHTPYKTIKVFLVVLSYGSFAVLCAENKMIEDLSVSGHAARIGSKKITNYSIRMKLMGDPSGV